MNGEFIFVGLGGVGGETSWNISYFGKNYFVLMLHLFFWEKNKRILNLHQSEFWTFVKLICEL